MKTWTTVIAACALPVGVAIAQQSESPAPEQDAAQDFPPTQHQEEVLELPSERFRQLDTDADGVISRSEAQTDRALGERWASLDANGDDELDEEEFLASGQSTDRPDEQDETVLARGEETEEEGIPATQHQEEVLDRDAAEDDGNQSSRSDAQSDDRGDGDDRR